MDDCIFCKIANNEFNTEKVYEDDKVVAFNDIAPQAQRHILIIPKEHIAGVAALTAENAQIVAHMVTAANKIAADAGLGNGYRLVINNGADAGQTVFHLHMHLLGGSVLGRFGA